MTEEQNLINLGVGIGCFSSLALYALCYQIPWLGLVCILIAFYCANEADKLLREMKE